VRILQRRDAPYWHRAATPTLSNFFFANFSIADGGAKHPGKRRLPSRLNSYRPCTD
jgi:hypothetical protein